MSIDKLLADAFPGGRSGPAAGPPRMRLVDLDADADGRLVGPVYKTGAEGQTFTREPRFIPRSRIRPDLPPTTAPGVYILL